MRGGTTPGVNPRVPSQSGPAGHTDGTRTVQNNLSVALVDPVPLFREGMSALVLRTPGLRWIGSTGHLHAAMLLHQRYRPDVMLIDSSLDPRCQLAQVLVSGDQNLAVLCLVNEPQRSAQFIGRALAVGVHGLVRHRAEPGQIVEAIRRTHAERGYLDPALAPLARSMSAPRSSSGAPSLSRREFEVLQLIADGMENQAIGKALFVSVETVRTHVKGILRKLRARDRTHAVALAFRSGLLTAHGEEHAEANREWARVPEQVPAQSVTPLRTIGGGSATAG